MSFVEAIPKRLAKFIIKRTLGQFLKKELDSNQLNVEWGRSEARLHLEDLDLNIEALNEVIAEQPLEIRNGYISSISLTLPWRDIINASCSLEINGLEITLCMTSSDEKDVFQSTMSEFLSSMSMAEDYQKQKYDIDDSEGEEEDNFPQNQQKRVDPGEEGLEYVAHLIDRILSRVTVSLLNTTIRVQYPSKTTQQTYIVILQIPEIKYRDDTFGNETTANMSQSKLIKNMTFSGLTIQVQSEAPKESDDNMHETMYESLNDFQESPFLGANPSNNFLSTSSTFYTTTTILSSGKENSLKLELKQPTCTLNIPNISVELFIRSCHLYLTPSNLALFQEILEFFLVESQKMQKNPTLESKIGDTISYHEIHDHDEPISKPMGQADFEKFVYMNENLSRKNSGDDDEESESQDSFDSLDLTTNETKVKTQVSDDQPKVPQNLHFKTTIKEGFLFLLASDDSRSNVDILENKTPQENHIKIELKTLITEFFGGNDKQSISVRINKIQGSEYQNLGSGFKDYTQLFVCNWDKEFSQPIFNNEKGKEKETLEKGKERRANSMDVHLNYSIFADKEKTLEINLNPIFFIVDPQIIDRYSEYFISKQTTKYTEDPLEHDGMEFFPVEHKETSVDQFVAEIDQTRRSALSTNVKLNCPMFRLKLFVPRTITELKWKGESSALLTSALKESTPLYPESLILDFESLQLCTKFSTLDDVQIFDLLTSNLEIFLSEPAKDLKRIVLLATESEQSPSIQITLRPSVTKITDENIYKKKNRDPQKDHEDLGIEKFQTNVIKSSFLFVNCDFPQCIANFTKREYDIADTLLNEISEWEPKFLKENANVGPKSDIYGPCGEDDSETETEIDTENHFEEKITEVPINPIHYHLVAIRAEISKLIVTFHEMETTPKSSSFQIIFNKVHSFKINKYSGQTLNYFWTDFEDFILFDVTKLRFSNLDQGAIHFSFSKTVNEQIEEGTIDSQLVPILFRTQNASIAPLKMLSVKVTSEFDFGASEKEIRASVCFQEVTLKHVYGSEWLFKLLNLLEEPDMPGIGYSFDSQVSRIQVSLKNISIDYKPLYSPSRVILFCEDASVATNVRFGSPILRVDFKFRNLLFFTINDVNYLQIHKEIYKEAEKEDLGENPNPWLQHFEQEGFLKLVESDEIDFSLRKEPGNEDFPSETKLDLIFNINNVALHTRADSFQSLSDIITYYVDGIDLQPLEKKKEEKGKKKMEEEEEEGEEEEGLRNSNQEECEKDLMASIDQSMFGTNHSPMSAKQNWNKAYESSLEEVENFSDSSDEGWISPYSSKLENQAQTLFNSDENILDTSNHSNSSVLTGSRNFGDSAVSNSRDPSQLTPELDSSSSQMEGFGAENAPEELVRILDPQFDLTFEEDYFSSLAKTTTEQPADGIPPPKDLPTFKVLHVKVSIGTVSWELFDGVEWESVRDEEKGLRKKKGKVTEEKPSVEESVDSAPVFQRSGTSDSFDEFAKFGNENIHDGNYDEDENQDLGFDQEQEHSDGYDKLEETESNEFWQPYETEMGKKVSPSTNRALAHRSKKCLISFKFEKITFEYEEYPQGLQYSSRLLALIQDVKILDNIETSSWKTLLTHLRGSTPRETDSNMVHYEVNYVRPNLQHAEEARMILKLLPLRLNIDQDAYDFLFWYFSYEAPISSQILKEKEKEKEKNGTPKPVTPTFFQSADIRSITIKLDYNPKVLSIANLTEGKLEELRNLFRVEDVQLKLSRVHVKGISGAKKLMGHVIEQWGNEVKSQAGKVAGGLSPIRPIVSLTSAALSLLSAPMQQYQTDGRFVYGFKKAATAFLTTTAVETINISTKIIVGTQVILVAVNDSIASENAPAQRKIQHSEPSSITEGIQQGYAELTLNLSDAAYSLFNLPMEEYHQRGAQSAIKVALRSVPTAILKPAYGVTEFANRTLQGVMNTISPEKKMDRDEKYGSPSQE